MIDRSTLDRRVADYFAGEATTRAPDATIDSIVARVAVTDQRRSASVRALGWWPPMSRSRRLLLLFAAALGLAGAVVVGSFLFQRHEPTVALPSLVLIESPRGAVGDASVPVSVIAVAADGSIRQLATLTSAALGGTYSEWWAETSPDGHLAVPIVVDTESTAAVVDLRAPGEPAGHPDANGSFPAFSADGRLAFQTNSGRYAIFDPLSRSTTFTGRSGEANPIQFPFAPIWAASGQGLIAQGPGDGDRSEIGVFRLDGSFIRGQTPAYFGGVGPRRFDAVGRYLDCPNCGGDPVELTATTRSGATERLWLDDQPTMDVTDFAWASDGAVWMLLESTAPGPRRVMLVKLTGDRRLERFADFQGAPDDPDPGSYFGAAAFAAIAPGDTSLVIELRAPGGGRGELWSIDPTTRMRTRLPAGIPAGWLRSTTLSAARPSVVRLVETDPALRGAWSKGPTTIRINRTSMALGTSDPTEFFAIDARTAGAVLVDGPDDAMGCRDGAGGSYRWAVDVDTLTMTSVNDPCAARSSRLAGIYRRTLPYPDTGSPPLTPGSRYFVPDADVPFTLDPPPGSGSSVVSHQDGLVGLGFGEGPGATIALLSPTAGFADICERHSSGGPAVTTIDNAAAYLLGLAPEATIVKIDPIVIGGYTSRSFRMDTTSCDGFATLFANTGGARVGVSTKGEIHLVALDGRRVVAVTTQLLDGAGDEQRRWIGEMLASIRFEPSG